LFDGGHGGLPYLWWPAAGPKMEKTLGRHGGRWRVFYPKSSSEVCGCEPWGCGKVCKLMI
jgi:hypothetical protein